MSEEEYTKKRERMVEEQIERRGISDLKVLTAMRHVKRHLFVESKNRPVAYQDSPLSIGYEQTISQPYIVALMTELLELEDGDKVLEVGTGSGYQAAILAEIVKEVYSIEIVEGLGHQARELLNELGYGNVHVKIGDGYYGWQEHAPFDGIIVTAAPDHIPQPLIDQLKPGAKMVIPVGSLLGLQHLTLVQKKDDGTVSQKRVELVRFVPLTRSDF